MQQRYFEAVGREPLEVINSILRRIRYEDRGEPEFFTEDGRTLGPDGDTTKISPMQYSLILWARGRYYLMSGTLYNRGMADDLRCVWEGDAELSDINLP